MTKAEYLVELQTEAVVITCYSWRYAAMGIVP